MIPRILLLWLLVCSCGNAQTLWQESKYGMSLEEVLRIFPKSRDGSFMVGKVKMVGPATDEARIAGQRFEVQFYFSAPDQKLGKVVLGCTDKLLIEQGAAVARQFVDLLTAKYGAAKETGDASSSDPRDIDVEWTTKEFISIRLSFFRETKLGPGAYRLSITYDGTKLRGAEKL